MSTSLSKSLLKEEKKGYRGRKKRNYTCLHHFEHKPTNPNHHKSLIWWFNKLIDQEENLGIHPLQLFAKFINMFHSKIPKLSHFLHENQSQNPKKDWGKRRKQVRKERELHTSPNIIYILTLKSKELVPSSLLIHVLKKRIFLRCVQLRILS